MDAGRVYFYRGQPNGSWAVEVVAGSGKSLEAQGVLTLRAAPNPFSSATSIRLTLAIPAEVVAEVRDALGRRVAVGPPRRTDGGWSPRARMRPQGSPLATTSSAFLPVAP